MNKKWLIIDCNYLCHRAKHSMGGLSYGNTPTGVIYGFLKTIIALQEQFRTKHIVFCWDSGTNKREEIFPAYKKKRKNRYKDLTDEEIEFEKAFRFQMKKLRKVYLKKIGYRNIFCQKGYEGDDLIASICLHLSHKDEAIIISADQDLYQCIRFNTSFYNPQKGKILTLQGFKKKYGIIPDIWSLVKCYSGCTTDEIVGIKGVGEKTAIKYIRGELKNHLKIYQKIHKQKSIYSKKNYPLVALPFEGTKIFELKKDKISKQGWKKVMEELGIKSIRIKNANKKKKSNRKLY